MTGPSLRVARSVVAEMARFAALEVPGVQRVARGGTGWLDALRGGPVQVRLRRDGVHLRVWIVARPRTSLPAVAGQVRANVAATIERLLGQRLGSVLVIIDGVGR